MKIIDILVNIANDKLADKTRFKVYSSSDKNPFICEYDNSYPGTIWCITDDRIKFNYKIDFMRMLNYEVEIIEEDKDIEGAELYQYVGNTLIGRNMWSFYYKINELVREVNRIKKRK